MNKNKHLVRSDRDTIKSMLDENCNFTQIAEAIGKARVKEGKNPKQNAPVNSEIKRNRRNSLSGPSKKPTL